MYLSSMVPQILASPVFQTQSAVRSSSMTSARTLSRVIIIPPHPMHESYLRGMGGHRFTFRLEIVKQNFKWNPAHNHYSFLHTLEWAWNLTPMTNNDHTASIMQEFFN